MIIDNEGLAGPTSCQYQESHTFDIGKSDTFSVTAAITVETPDAITSGAWADSVLEVSAPLNTNTKVAVTTADTLPTGLSATNYYIIYVDATHVQLSETPNGAAVSFDDDGTGTITLTPAALSAGKFYVDWSNNGTDFVNSISNDITTSTCFGVQLTTTCYKYLRLRWEIESGVLTLNTYYVSKVDLD